MNIKLVWSLESLSRLQDIEDYIAKDNPNEAIKFVNRIIERAESIIQHPKKGRIVPEIAIENIRELLYKNYRIVYQIKSKSIVILTVFEGHKLFPK